MQLGRWVLALSFVALAWGACHGAPRRSSPIEARLELAAGEVRAGAPGDLRSARTGAVVPSEGQLETGPGARALARLSDGSAVVLRGDTRVGIDGPSVTLDAGQLFVDAAPGEGRTPSKFSLGEARITGEQAAFFLTRDGAGGTVVVARGRVAVDAPTGRVEVAAGEQAVLGSGPPAVSAVAWFDDWTGGMADPRAAGDRASGAGRVYGVGDGGARPLDIQRQDVRAVVRAGMMETRVEQTFFNPYPRDLEGWYWFRLPEGAMVTGYAVEFGGQLVEGEFVERDRARVAYGAASRAGLAPSLLEWVDARTVRAKIDPIPAMGTRRVSLRYLQRLEAADGVLRVTYPLRSDDPPRIGEFSLTVDLGAEGRSLALSTLEDARVEQDGQLVTMRRTDFVPRTDFVLEARAAEPPAPLRVSRYSTGADTADYVMVRFRPDIDWETVGPQAADVVVLVDTSAGIDPASRQLQAATVEAVLRALSATDRFALVSVDVDATALHPATGLAPASEESTSAALERLSEHGYGGATDLSAAWPVALGLLHDAPQPAIVYVGDGEATTGDLGGERLREELRAAMSGTRARFYALGVGPGANAALLGELARAGGGRAYAVDRAEEATERALWLAADVKTPTLTDLVVDLGAGMDSVFDTAGGKVSAGEEVLVLGRTHQPLPDKVVVTGSLAGKPVTYTETPVDDDPLVAGFAPKQWAQASIQRRLGGADRPDELWGQVAREGIEYGLLTPYSSVLVLEDEAAYQRMGVPRGARPLRGTHLVDLPAAPLAAGSLGCGAAEPPPAALREAPLPMAPAAVPPAAVPMAVGGDMDRMAKGRPEEPEEEEDGAVARPPAVDGTLALVRGRRDHRAKAEEKTEAERPARDSAEPSSCSDLSGRPLADRVPLWRRALAAGTDPWAVYASAAARCEIGDWAAQSTLLDLVAAKVDGPVAARVLAGLAGDLPARERFSVAVLRRATDPALVDAVLAGQTPVDWAALEAELGRPGDPEAQLARVRAAVAAAPSDPRGARLLVRALARAGRTDELRITVQRLRERGASSPLVAREIGDALAAAGDRSDAVRTYSEMVEFDPHGPTSRLLLGDVLLAHGWYDAAYRQFTTLVDRGGDARAQIRQAIAAAGAGRTFEALQTLRAVAASPSRQADAGPGSWAELWAAAVTAELLAKAPAPGSSSQAERDADGLRRRLKELPYFRAPAELVVVTWEDLDARVELSGREGQRYDGASVGVVGVVRPLGTAEDAVPVRVGGGALAARVHHIRWDGAKFEVAVDAVTLGEG